MFKRTGAQKKLTELITGDARHVLAYGGSRSGKTFYLLRAVILRAQKTRSAHLIVRNTLSSIKQSIWHDTMPKVRAACFPDAPIIEHKADCYYELPNGSTVWLGGLDDKERTEKILGREYSTIYLNECSEIGYHSVGIARTRLAENSGLKLRMYYDCNPPDMEHWVYKEFIQHINPIDQRALDEKNFVSILMNPDDNIENLPDDYIKSLDDLPEHQRMRFRYGKFTNFIEGAFWSEQYDRALKEQRITRVPYDTAYPVTTWWDIGYSDHTAIWYAQVIGREIRLIDYWQDARRGPDEIVQVLKDRGYQYQSHHLPHDCGTAQFTLKGKTIQDQFRDLWPSQDWRVERRTLDKYADINNARLFWSRCVFDRERCYNGLECLRNYKSQKDEKRNVYISTPVHDWASHGADAFLGMVTGIDSAYTPQRRPAGGRVHLRQGIA